MFNETTENLLVLTPKNFNVQNKIMKFQLNSSNNNNDNRSCQVLYRIRNKIES